MSIPSVVHVFESGINAASTSTLEALVRRQLEIATRELSMTAPAPASTPPVHPKTLISDMGDYLTQAARVWSRLTDNLVNGSHVEMAAVDAHEQSRLGNHVSELSPLFLMDVELRRLCKIRDLTEKFSREVQEIWLPVPPASPDTPVPVPAPQTAFSSFEMKRTPLTRPPVVASEAETRVHGSQKALPTSQMSPGHPSSPCDIASMSDDSEEDEDEDEQFARIDMEALKQRGKGSYYCPLGHRCDKGGVDKDGNLVLFDRNSSFAYACHLAHSAYLNPLETFTIR
ncbi:hypothetical protein BGZ61DRAFT_181107 [Ilyonectria robusta]|uniref:uncharacterized protein n=1 Tax=Ilyonectria robusta TaxID=1079257 RepID=UPI001E8DAAD4|nr:uncharacterized protein BGZ61DRAFT_181107 [Ilyonectria robusta]KAH8729389.1 hypothetical protein BGZ61DRAFT_181107 [Ilyonectria robusta]